MKRFVIISFLTAFLFICYVANAGSPWQRVYSGQSPAAKEPVRKGYLLYMADEAELKARLNAMAKGQAETTIDLPMPDGGSRNFVVRRSSLLPPQLAAKYPGLATYDAIAA